MNKDEFIDAMALAVSDSFTSPEVFGTVCRQIAIEKDISEADASSVMIACYGLQLWKEASWGEFAKDFIDTVFEEG